MNTPHPAPSREEGQGGGDSVSLPEPGEIDKYPRRDKSKHHERQRSVAETESYGCRDDADLLAPVDNTSGPMAGSDRDERRHDPQRE